MSNFEFDFPLPKQQKKLLLDIVKLAREHNVLSIPYSSSLDSNYVHHISVVLDDMVQIGLDLSEDPALAFEMLGFVKYDEEKGVIVLTPKVFKWANYENKNWFLKFLARLPSKVKDFMIFVAFVLSLALTVLQILQSLKPTP